MKLKFSFPNLLALVAVVLMVVGITRPWWSLTLFGNESDIYPYQIVGPLRELLGYKRSPQMLLLTRILIGAVVLVALGSVLRGWPGRILIALGGIIILLGISRFLGRIAEVAEGFNVPIQGHGIGDYGGFAKVEVSTRLRTGLYLTRAGGIVALVASVVHGILQPRRK
ncbi:MAG: hypothetical protein ACP5Q1_07125 [Anaerolineae bacterium]